MLPREWTYTAPPMAGIASIVVPAAAGLTPVVTSITARAGATNAAVQLLTFFVLDGVTSIFTWNLLLPESVGPPITSAQDSFDGPISLIGTIARSMTIAFTGAVINGFEELLITGYHF